MISTRNRPPLSPEAQLLRRAVCPRPGSLHLGRIPAPNTVDWDSLFKQAARHRVLPRLYRYLTTVYPDREFQSLRENFYATKLHNRFLGKELLRILDLLAAHQIEALPYKGPALAAATSGGLELRQFSDLDLLLERDDILPARRLLAPLGYRPVSPLSPDQEARYVQSRRQYDYHLKREPGGTELELHWQITTIFPVGLPQLRAHVEPVNLLGQPVPHLAPEALLPVLCIHGAKHRWRELRLVGDVAALLHHRPRLGWTQTLGLARQWGCHRLLLLGLALAAGLLAAPLPEQVWAEIDRERDLIQIRMRQVWERLFWEREGPPGIVDTLLLQDSRQAQAAYLLHLGRLLASRSWPGRTSRRAYARTLLNYLINR